MNSQMLNLVFGPIRSVVEWSVLALSEKSVCDHFTLYTEAGSRERTLLLGKIQKSLELIQATDPIRFSLVKRYLGRIAVARKYRVEYWGHSHVSVMNTGFVEASSEAYVAHVLIYHAMQARLRKNGFYHSEAVRIRSEALSIRAQMAFLQRLSPDEWPNLSRLLDSLTSRLAEIANYTSQPDLRR